ncbi:MAG: cytochrome c maturation protein CcmE [Candidatus Pelagibacter sp.]|nr:cytochrome c maturation protein CcmE [Candidatus Pelagibacter sp.]OUW24342.1 MAG: cytochrome c biogenesis protein CcmE [Rickettsiales bacterium TMED174]|tara:strand:+ start:2484 stop:2906 length:423 start_codon:yes stop_codon:yes gene_type:complete
MLTKKVKIRLLSLSALTFFLVVLIYFVLNALNKNILYFKTPSEIYSFSDLEENRSLRVGGMVKKNSIEIDKDEIKFIITDFKNEILVSYRGTVPNLFSEEKGVIAEGKFNDKKFFLADRILAKHDENYIPPELKEIEKND